MITPRRTRLIRVSDLHAFRRVIGVVSDRPRTIVIVPNRAAAVQIQRTLPRSNRDGPLFLSRDDMYAELHSRFAGPPRLTQYERDAMAQAAALEAAKAVPDLPFRVRPGLVGEMLKFYDQLRRQSQTVDRFGELIEQAIGKALEFHDMIGSERKEKRLHYLKNYWMEKVKDIPKVKLNTSLNPKWGCAIGNIGIEGKKPGELDNYLLDKHKIHTFSIVWENISGIRVTPNVYTTTKNLDLLVEGITEFARS